MSSFCQQKFIQFLSQRFHVLQCLTQRLPESALQRWEGVVLGMRDDVTRLQIHGLEKGTRMQETSQVAAHLSSEADVE